MAVDFSFVRKHCASVAKQRFEEFDRRKATWAEVCREFYPLGVAGLTKNIEQLADECYTDEDHRLLTMRPPECVRKGAAGFHANLTSPLRQWFRFRIPAFLTENGETTHDQRMALDRLTKATMWVFTRAAVYASLYKIYEHLLTVGFGCMIISSDARRIIRAQTLRLGTYALGIGADHTVNQVVRRFSWNAQQIVEEFGEAGVTETILEAKRKGNTTRRWTIYNLIEPNAVGDERAYDPVAKKIGLDDSMIYRSVYWLANGKDGDPQDGVLRITGFTVRPIVAPRFDYEIGDTYGRGPGLDGLDLARGTQTFRGDCLRVSGNRAQPAVYAAADFEEEGLKLGRGAVNYVRFGEQRGAMVAPVFPNPPDAESTRNDFTESVVELRDLFFNSAFATIDALKNQKGVKTATEVEALVRENMERLGAVITNLDKELLDPLVGIVAQYTVKSGIAPLSDEDAALFGDQLNIEYVSQIHLAQKQSQIGSVRMLTEYVGALAEIKPDAVDHVSTHGLVTEFADMVGAPEVCMATDNDIAAAKNARQEAQAAQMEAERQAAQAKALKDVGSIPVTDDTAAGQLLKSTQMKG